MRLFFAIRMFFRILFRKRFAQTVRGLLAEQKREEIEETGEAEVAIEAPEAEAAVEPAEALEGYETGAIGFLSMMQSRGRLVDFLMEEIDGFADAQIGGAVRAIHRDCRRVLIDCLDPEPVMDQRENAAVTIEEGFDPSAIRLTGDLSGPPPFRGVLRHRGWRAARVHLPAPVAGADPRMIMAADVEVTRRRKQ